MKNVFQVRLLGFSNLLEIEGAWAANDFVALLEAMEYGDVSRMSDAELREMCIMSLQDLEPVEAAYLVLKHLCVPKSRFSEKQREFSRVASFPKTSVA